MTFNDAVAESIQKMAILVKENIDEYLTISAEVAQTTVQLMKFYVDTKKLLYGFPLITIPPSDEIPIGPSISQEINTIQGNDHLIHLNDRHDINKNDNILNKSSRVSNISSSIDPFDGVTFDTCIKRILLFRKRTISSTQLAQMLRVKLYFY